MWLCCVRCHFHAAFDWEFIAVQLPCVGEYAVMQSRTYLLRAAWHLRATVIHLSLSLSAFYIHFCLLLINVVDFSKSTRADVGSH